MSDKIHDWGIQDLSIAVDAKGATICFGDEFEIELDREQAKEMMKILKKGLDG